jgi:hypothetical protein
MLNLLSLREKEQLLIFTSCHNPLQGSLWLEACNLLSLPFHPKGCSLQHWNYKINIQPKLDAIFYLGLLMPELS